MKQLTIIHNPLCSKSREALRLIEQENISVEIFDYLNGQLSKELLEKVIKLLDSDPSTLLRTKEEDYQKLTINESKQEEVIHAILKYPKILERPIVIGLDQAIIARPPEKVKELF